MSHVFIELGRLEGTSGSLHPASCRFHVRNMSRRGVHNSKDEDSTAYRLGPLFQNLTTSEKGFVISHHNFPCYNLFPMSLILSLSTFKCTPALSSL